MDELTELKVNLIPLSVIALNKAAEITGDSRTDTINRALQLYAFICAKKEAGYKLVLKLESTELILTFDLLENND